MSTSSSPQDNQASDTTSSQQDKTAPPSAEETKAPHKDSTFSTSYPSSPSPLSLKQENTGEEKQDESAIESKESLSQKNSDSSARQTPVITQPTPPPQQQSSPPPQAGAPPHAGTPPQAGVPPQLNSPIPPQFSSAQPQPTSQASINNWAMLTHLSGLAGIFFGAPIGFAGPLIIWLIQKEQMPILKSHFHSAINFQISWAIGIILSWVFIAISSILAAFIVGLFLLPFAFLFAAFVYIGGIIVNIMGAVKASNGENYRYPMTIDFIK